MTELADYIYALILGAYVLVLAYVTVYCLLQLHLLAAYLRSHRKPLSEERLAAPTKHAPAFDAGECPLVTVQVPLYNELYVATRIIDAVAAFDYPADRLQIQVLDDSDDATVEIVAARVAAWRERGIDLTQVRRAQRQGFKAGALADGLQTATGEFIAIFDADFVPQPDFLRRSIPPFAAPDIGVVQSRWQHLNEEYSLITQLQALQLNVHFTVEQAGRRAAGLFAQFNGTAGVWRRSCIEDADGWRALTLTEDLDLSMRAQLRGWQIAYLEDNPAPAELPAEMNAFKSQQHRWMKGGAECARILLPQVWRCERLSWIEKFHTTAHLLASFIFVFVFLIGVLSLPAMAAVIHFDLPPAMFSIFLSATLAVGAVYYVGNVRASWTQLEPAQGFARFIMMFPLFLSLSMGLSLHNGWAVLEGLWGKRSDFVRTPKFAIPGTDAATARSVVEANVYRGRKLSLITWIEGLLALVFAVATVWGFWSGNDFFVIFHLMLTVGYGSIFGITLAHRGLRQTRPQAVSAAPGIPLHVQPPMPALATTAAPPVKNARTQAAGCEA